MRKNRAYLEQEMGEWSYDFVYSSIEPLKAMDFEIRPFDSNDLEDTLLCYPLDIKKDVIIGSVGATNKFFEACGIEPPSYLGYPEELQPFMGRLIDDCRFGDLTTLFKMPYFIKPMKGIKKFTGCVIRKEQQFEYLRQFDGVTDNDEVYVSEVVDIVSEYRCFVHEEELKGIQFYQGDFTKFPCVNTIKTMVSTYKSANVAYTLDVGITNKGETILIEVNDMWAIGSYGFDSRTYTLMCVRRMREIGRQAEGETEPLWKRLKKDDKISNIQEH